MLLTFKYYSCTHTCTDDGLISRINMKWHSSFPVPVFTVSGEKSIKFDNLSNGLRIFDRYVMTLKKIRLLSNCLLSVE